MRLFSSLVFISTAALAQDFEAPNRQLNEQSYSRSCDGFTAFLKANPQSPLAREAQIKRIAACAEIGKAKLQELTPFATAGEKDFARAFAAYWLNRKGMGSPPIELLSQAARGEGRTANDARRYLVDLAMREIEYCKPSRADELLGTILEFSNSPNEKARARLARARSYANQNNDEKYMVELSKENTDSSDDALYFLGERRENNAKYVEALEFYDALSRFSDTSSNTKQNGLSRAQNIRRPVLNLAVSYDEHIGQSVNAQLNFRNMPSAKFTIHKIDPTKSPEGTFPNGPQELLKAAVGIEKTFEETFVVPNKHAPGNKSLELKVSGPGVYVIEAKGEGLMAQAYFAVSSLSIITKTDISTLLVFVADTDTGVAQANAEIAYFTGSSGNYTKKIATTDATGLARLPLDHADWSGLVWAKKDNSYARAGAGSNYRSSYSEQTLAYVMTDRPLYKPGETVGFKVFLRTRSDGPSVPMKNQVMQLKVYDSLGKEVLSQEMTSNEFGTGVANLVLPKNAALGAWRSQVTAQSRYLNMAPANFRVEEYKAPEFSVSIAPSAEVKAGKPVKAKVKVNYFSGGAVSNATGRALVSVTYWNHQFGRWPGEESQVGTYDDYNEYRRNQYYGTLAQHTIAFKTQADGTAEIELPVPPSQIANYKYNIELLVTDASRREINGSGTINVSSEPYFVDARSARFIYKPGERVGVQLRAENANGEPSEVDVVLRLSRVNADGTKAKFAEVRSKIVAGKGTAQLDADALGQVTLDVLDGNSAQDKVLASTSLWLTNENKPIVPPSSGFQVLLDETAPLKSTDVLRVIVATQIPGGHVLVTLETDTLSVVKSVEMVGRARFIELPLNAALAPNCTLHVMRIENGNTQQLNRIVKVKGGSVELPISVSFDPANAEPGSKVAAKVSATGAPSGAQFESCLSVVDESIFAIEPERKDFLTFFGQMPRHNTVRTYASLWERSVRPRRVAAQPEAKNKDKAPADLASDGEEKSESRGGASARREAAPKSPRGALADEMEAPPMASAPSAASAAKESLAKKSASAVDDSVGFEQIAKDTKARSDFSSSSGWYASIADNKGAFTQAIQLKDSLTSWKAIATTVTDGAHVGQGSKTLRTSKALMVRLQAPRFFIEGDEVTLSAVVENHLPGMSEIDVAIDAPGLKPTGKSSGKLKLQGETIGRFDARFKVVELGERTIKAAVRFGKSSDVVEWKLPSLVHGSAQRQFFAAQLSDTFSFDFELPAKRKAPLTKLEVVLSPSLLSVMFDGLPYLAQYPYGCVEQTLSRFVPATIAQRAARELKLPMDRLPAQLEDMTQKGLQRLVNFQHSDGGWGWWETDTTNPWMTAYVVYALSLAKEAGLAVDANMISRGRESLKRMLGNARNTSDTHAFMVFALGVTGGAPKTEVDFDFERRTSLSSRARAQLAVALLAMKDSRGRIAVENLDDIVKAATTRNDAAVGNVSDASSTSAAIEATAFTLMAYARYDLKSPLIKPLTDFLVLRRNGGKWRNTRDTAFALYALSDLAKREGAPDARGTFVIHVNGKEVKRVAYVKGGLNLTSPVVLNDSDLSPGKNTISITRDGTGTGYYAATLDVFNMNDFIKGVGGDVTVKRTYTLLGKPSTEPKLVTAAEYGMPVESGLRVRVDLVLTANKAVEFVMIEDLKPAGFEAVEIRSGPQVCQYKCAHAELKIDRVAMFIPEVKIGTTTLSYELRAEVPGRFAALPARFEAMYAPEIQATADEMRFEVRDTGLPVASQ
jgi:alpha-2-macroglobulin